MWRNGINRFCRPLVRTFTTSVQENPVRRKAYTALFKNETVFQEGAEIEGFVVQQVQKVHEFNLFAVFLVHKLTGAEYLHLSRDDNNNAFSVGFRTTPFDSTGVPHILEHTTLCGSVYYPCRDPFFKMLNRSMATFMNALTGPDYTMYPFTTQNFQDYINLMSVYLDAVFNPRLREIDFLQEGWRLEHEDINNPNSPIIFKGVVFNEMKGNFSDPQSVFSQSLLNNILPSHTYGHVSGGDPNKIPLLTYDDLKAFHSFYYSPANARFFSYGNFPLFGHLNYINENYLQGEGLSKLESTKVPSEPRWTTPRRKHISCRHDPLVSNPKKQSTIAVNVLLDDIKDLESGFDWNVLSELLVSGPNSAFYKTLVEPQIGSGFSPSTGFEAQTRDTFFSVGLQGVAQEDFDKVVDIFERTVDNVIKKGFEEHLINAVLHGIELNIKHQISNFGLSMLFGVTPLWIHEADIMKALRVNDQIAHFKQRIKKNPRYLQELVDRKLKTNSHKLILTMSPDHMYEMRLAEEEKRLLDSKVKQLTSSDKQRLFEQGQKLFKEQSQVQDSSCLPTLRVSDLQKDVEGTIYRDIDILSVPVQCCGQPTNEIVYFRGIINVCHLSEEQKMLLPLFANIATKMGTKKCTFRELDQRINLYTGGVTFVHHTRGSLDNLASHEEGVLISSYSLDRNVGEMFAILSEIFNELTLDDVNRFSTLTRISAAELANGIIDRGHLYAMLSSGSLVNGSALYKEKYAGLTYIDEMRRISQLEDLSQVLGQLKEIAASILNKQHLRCAVNYTVSSEPQVLKSIELFLQSLPGLAKDPLMFSATPEVKHDHRAVHHVLPIPVNFAAKSLKTVAFTHEDSAPLTVLAQLLSSKYLHSRIREKGGAYGSGAIMSSSGTFSFFSYRDPNSCVTLDAFDESVDWINEDKFTEIDIEEAKLGVFQRVDAPIPPGQIGMERFLNGVTDSILQERRKRLMAVTKDDLHLVAKKYLSDKSEQTCGRALIGPANTELKSRTESWLILPRE